MTYFLRYLVSKKDLGSFFLKKMAYFLRRYRYPVKKLTNLLRRDRYPFLMATF